MNVRLDLMTLSVFFDLDDSRFRDGCSPEAAQAVMDLKGAS